MTAVMHKLPTPFAQDSFEFFAALEHARGARRILEVGARFGNSTVLLAMASRPGSMIVVVDLCDDPYAAGVDIRSSLERNVEGLQKRGHDVVLLRGDSHSAQMISGVACYAPYDFGFIDADHTYEGVKADWQAYGSMCNVVAFHDINAPAWGVRRLWQEIKPEYVTAEYIRGGMGIGIVFRGIRRFGDD